MSGSRPAPYAPGLAAEDARAGPARVGAGGDVGRDVLRAAGCRPRRCAGGRAGPRRRAACTTCGKASRKKPEMRSVTSTRGRPSSSRGHELEAGHPAGRLVPDRPHAEQPQRLGDVVAGGAHRAGAPDDEADRHRVLAVVGDVALEQRVAERATRPPRRCATGWPWGRRSRSCGRSAARRPGRGSASRTGPAGTKPPDSPCSRLSSSSVVRASRGTTSSQAKRSDRLDVRERRGRSVATTPGTASRGPARGRRAPSTRPARQLLELVGLPRGRPRPARTPHPAPGAGRAARRSRRPRSAARAARRARGRPRGCPTGGWPSTCRPSRIRTSLTSHR